MRASNTSGSLRNACGFTVVEVLVAISMSAIMFALVSGTIRFQSDIYVSDIARVRIQQNLRGTLDIVAMNVRQAGEGLDAYFPALTLVQQNTPSTSKLTIRRKIVSEVFSTCKVLNPGDSEIYVSDDTSIETACFPANVAASVATWSAYRASKSTNVPIYIYDRVGKNGEFVNYLAEGVTGGDNYLQIQPVVGTYPARSTSIYILEEYSFSLDQPTDTLQLFTNGDTDTPQDVAYHVTDFQVRLTMNDGSARTSLAPTDTLKWKDIRAVSVNLAGDETWKTKTFNRTVSGSFFPRNVLSH